MSKSDAYRAMANHYGELAREQMSNASRARLLQIERSYLLIARAEEWLTTTPAMSWSELPRTLKGSGDA